MKEYFKEQKQSISDFVKIFLDEQKVLLGKIHPFGDDLCDKLCHFLIGGKMIRGGLVALSYQLFHEQITEDITKMGGLIEFIQSGLLIHDDIMDRDLTRRGEDSLFYQYTKKFETEKMKDAYHTGEALGICAGDIAYFLAFQIISQLTIPLEMKNSLIAFVSGELSKVGVAQMLDVYWGAAKAEINEAEILKLYCYKTGRYTFSLPLWIGGLFAGQSHGTLSSLIELGENLGIIFQIKDDELDLFGSQKITGKPQGSDLREGKQTLFVYYLKQAMNEADNNEFLEIFAKKNSTDSDIGFILSLIEKYNIRETIGKLVNEKNDKIKEIVDCIKIENSYGANILQQLIEYNITRAY